MRSDDALSVDMSLLFLLISIFYLSLVFSYFYLLFISLVFLCISLSSSTWYWTRGRPSTRREGDTKQGFFYVSARKEGNWGFEL